jgi:hypothetical protein
MSILDNLISNAITVQNQLEGGQMFREICERYEAEICDMNAEDQLFERGVNRVGVDIMDYAPYQPKTIEIKQIKGQPYNRVTLRDEGDFHSSFYVDFSNQGFEIKASDEKTEHLVNKYGRQILGLTDENAFELASEYIQPDLITRIQELL